MGKKFTQLYDKLMWPLEKVKLQAIRKEIISHADGRVLEVGSGTGINFTYYPKNLQVDAVEPDPMMRNRSINRLSGLNKKITTHLAGAERLPFRDNTFDTVIATLVFCSIPDPALALKELYRVSKPGAKIYLLEHVEMKTAVASRLQKWLTPIWKQICGGCHLDRDTLALVRQSDWKVNKTASFYSSLFLYLEAIKQ